MSTRFFGIIQRPSTSNNKLVGDNRILVCHLHIKLTTLYRVLDKKTVSQFVTELLGFYLTRRSITVFTTSRHWSLFLARWIQPTSSILPTTPIFSYVVSSLQDIGLKFCMHFTLLHVHYMFHPYHSPWFNHRSITFWRI